MKAVVFNKYGGNDVVEIKDMAMPTLGPDDVLIKVRAAGVNPVDWKVRNGMARIFTGSRFPRILGCECAGEVVATGANVAQCKKSDAVIGFPGVRILSAFAEYVSVPEHQVYPKPKNLLFQEASAIPIAGLTALQALRDHGKSASGEKVLINGASGGVGMFAVQIAKIFGAHVTAVCSGANAKFVKSLGADAVIDYKNQDFTKGDDRYDIIFDAVSLRSFGECRKVLAPNGVYVNTLPAFSVMVNRYITGFLTSKKARTVWVKPDASDMEWIKAQIEAGKIKVVIDRTYPLNQAKEALAYSETGRAKGKIVIMVI